ncbi:MAG: hypothetical protein ABI885_25120, partial [Gammaproteobacteria bacterium]
MLSAKEANREAKVLPVGQPQGHMDISLDKAVNPDIRMIHGVLWQAFTGDARETPRWDWPYLHIVRPNLRCWALCPKSKSTPIRRRRGGN